MKCFVGVDLGSTTTKAVVLDENERLLGRGITNSRSNYDIACAVARSEAFINARFGLFARALEQAGLSDAECEGPYEPGIGAPVPARAACLAAGGPR